MAELLHNVRRYSDAHFKVTLSDSDVPVSWDSVTIQRLFMYSERQKSFGGKASFQIGADPHELLVTWHAYQQQFLGVHRVVIQLELAGGVATYDAQACNVVASTSQDTDIETEEIDVAIEVSEVDTTIMHEILEACQEATVEANEAAAAAGAAVAVLQGGQAGQVLAKRSNSPLDFEWKTAEETPILQEEGQRTDAAMSQKAVTDSLAGKQAVIDDLAAIRSGAANGTAALARLNALGGTVYCGFLDSGIFYEDEELLHPITPNEKDLYINFFDGKPYHAFSDGEGGYVYSALNANNISVAQVQYEDEMGDYFDRVMEGAFALVSVQDGDTHHTILPVCSVKNGWLLQSAGPWAVAGDFSEEGFDETTTWVAFISWLNQHSAPLGSGRDDGAVRFDEAQSLADAQKGAARTNIGAASAADVTELEQEVDENTEDIEALKANLDRFGDVHAQSIDLDNLPKVCGYDMSIIGTGAPSFTPDFIGQIYIDTSGGKVYMATATTNSASFKALN